MDGVFSFIFVILFLLLLMLILSFQHLKCRSFVRRNTQFLSFPILWIFLASCGFCFFFFVIFSRGFSICLRRCCFVNFVLLVYYFTGSCFSKNTSKTPDIYSNTQELIKGRRQYEVGLSVHSMYLKFSKECFFYTHLV